jgi:hypothetical protein
MGKLVKSDFVYQNWAWVKRISVFINLGYITLKVSTANEEVFKSSRPAGPNYSMVMVALSFHFIGGSL